MESWIVILDGNGLKEINDTGGHKAGDAYLKKIADGLSRSGRGTDIIARHGGDEFTVILPNTTLEGLNSWWKRKLELFIQNQVSVSAGAARIDPENPENSLELADLRNYVSKSRYRKDKKIYLSFEGGLEELRALFKKVKQN